MRKQFSGNAIKTTLASTMASTDVSLTVASSTGFPVAGPFVITVNRNQPDEEKILVTARTLNSFTFPVANRGWDGTTAQGHASGATVEHTLDADTINEANAHVNDTTRDDHSQYLNVVRHNTATIHQFGASGAFGVAVAPQPVGTTLGAGSSNTPAAADHIHTVGTGAINASGMFAAGVVNGAAIAAGAVDTTKIAATTIVDANVSATAAIALNKLATSGVTAGSYGNALVWPSFTVNAQGALTVAGTVTAPVYFTFQTSSSFGTFTQLNNNSFNVVSGSTVTITNPGKKVNIRAEASGWIYNGTDTSSDHRVRVGISTDGGSTWAYGSTIGAKAGTNPTAYGQLCATDAVDGVTPSGNIQARLEWQYTPADLHGPNNTFQGGFISVFAAPA